MASCSDVVDGLNRRIVDCRRCPRLVAWRETVAAERKRAYRDQEYWGRPVPLFGDSEADRLILGLAPAAHGANRTGRMFTGDRSGDFLYAALFRAGVASQPTSVALGDGLRLRGALVAATAHCAPPDNKPLPEEVENCSLYLDELLASRPWRSVLCLGGIAWTHLHRRLGRRAPKFGHGVVAGAGPVAVGCYHPSQQNTFTGRLTPEMLDDAIRVWREAGGPEDAPASGPTGHSVEL
jgi:uracil-DNA glycosylase